MIASSSADHPGSRTRRILDRFFELFFVSELNSLSASPKILAGSLPARESVGLERALASYSYFLFDEETLLFWFKIGCYFLVLTALLRRLSSGQPTRCGRFVVGRSLRTTSASNAREQLFMELLSLIQSRHAYDSVACRWLGRCLPNFRRGL